MNPIDLVSALPWRRAVFTTYSLSLSFFEAVVLDALVRGGGREALILSDVAGVQAALMEQGARRAGRDYLVEPVAVGHGVFHPKISVFVEKDECHMLVGSGNLTFGGWGGNFEVCEHLHPSFAAEAMSDASEFFEYLGVGDSRLRHGAGEHCSAIAEELRAAVRGRASTGDIRLFHNLDGSILEKLAQQVDGLGGAERLIVAAPFWDDGVAIDRLCRLVGLDSVFVHAHAHGTVEGRAGANWPSRCGTEVSAIRLDAMADEKPRRLHAKVFEVICRRGRILMSGSANASFAALEGGHNVEACVVRIQREKTVGWSFSTAEPLPPGPTKDEEPEDQEIAAGVLRAELEVDHIVGQVLTPRLSGPARAFQVTSGMPNLLGAAHLDDDGRFKVAAPGLELEAWKGRRLTLRVDADDGRRAEGFVSVSAFTEISRRAGALAPQLMAIIAGNETPGDVAAIFSWFNEDPRRLDAALTTQFGGGPPGKHSRAEDTVILVAELDSRFTVSGAGGAGGGSEPNEAASWKRFMEHLFAAFRERREPFAGRGDGSPGEDDDDEADGGGGGSVPTVDPAEEHSLRVFESLFELMLSAENETRHAFTAYELTRYVCDRLRPEPRKVMKWLQELADALTRHDFPSERREEISAVVLLLLGAGLRDKPALRKTRARLLRVGVDMSGAPPSREFVHGLEEFLGTGESLANLWSEVQKIRTFSEQVKEYLVALECSTPSDGYPDLGEEARDEWPSLREAFISQSSRRKILVIRERLDACPHCFIRLPVFERGKLRSIHVATCRSCGRIIICEG